MKSIGAHTQNAKGLTTLNLLSLLTCLVMYILIPILTVMADIVSSRAVYIISIILFVSNVLFYILPANIKAFYFQRRLFVVYLPTLVIIGLGIWQFIVVLINIKILQVLTLIFAFIVMLPPVTFSLLIKKLIQEEPTLLG